VPGCINVGPGEEGPWSYQDDGEGLGCRPREEEFMLRPGRGLWSVRGDFDIGGTKARSLCCDRGRGAGLVLARARGFLCRRDRGT